MLTAHYDLYGSPPTYEVVSFLMRAERERIARGEDSLRIVFLPGPLEGFRRDNLWPHGGGAREAMLRNVCVPLCWLLPSVVDVQVEPHRPGNLRGFGVAPQRLYGFKQFVDAYAQGVRPLRERVAPSAREPDLLTITLREAVHWPARNSNVPAWLAAARRLQERGWRAVVVRDTATAHAPLPDVVTDAAAAMSIAPRAALYARAALNLFVSNGPAYLCLAMDLPTLMFRPVNDGLGLAFSRRHWSLCGVAAGVQLPGAPDYQHLVWQDDTADNIVAAVESMLRERRSSCRHEHTAQLGGGNFQCADCFAVLGSAGAQVA
jgi:hypothetical protein